MKKLTLLFIFISLLGFSQEKQVFDTVTYNELIVYYSKKLKLQNDTLEQNIERCRQQLSDAEKKDNQEAVITYKVILKGLMDAQSISDKNKPFITVYKDQNYTFYNSENKFIGRIYSEKFKKSKETDYLLKEYFYLLQE